MKNSKKFNNVAKKGLAVALAVLSLTGGMQNVSAMRPTGTKLELNYLMNVMQNIHDKEMLKKFEQVSKKCGDTFEGTFMNPISVTKKNAEKFFPKLETQYLYSKNDKKIWDEEESKEGEEESKEGEEESKEGEEESKKGKKYAYDYLWNESAAISNANFITRKDMDDKSFLEVDNCDIKNENYKKPDTVKLIERESAIYESIKKFILSDQADFNEIDPMYHKQKCFETIYSETFGNGVECQIKKFKDRNETQKAFVCVLVPDDGTFTGKNMDTIKQKLSGQSLATHDGTVFNFKNVNLVIRPKTRTAKFEIGEYAISRCFSSTINAQGATISGEYAINWCDNATINAQGATISWRAAICCCKGSTINVQGATISEEIAAFYHFLGSTINAQEATTYGKFAICYCDNSTINAQGATISEKYAIRYCDSATINVNEEQVYDVAHKVHGINVKINGRSPKEIENEKYSNLNDFIEKTFGERRKDDKETEE